MNESEFNQIIADCASRFGIQPMESEQLFIEALSESFDGCFVYKKIDDSVVSFYVSKPNGIKKISYSPRIKAKVKTSFTKKALERSIKNRISILKEINKKQNGVCLCKITRDEGDRFLVNSLFGYGYVKKSFLHTYQTTLAIGEYIYLKIHSYSTKGDILKIYLNGKDVKIDRYIIDSIAPEVISFYRNDKLIKLYFPKKPSKVVREKFLAIYTNQNVKFIWSGG